MYFHDYYFFIDVLEQDQHCGGGWNWEFKETEATVGIVALEHI